MKTLIYMFLTFTPCFHLDNPDKPIWADRQDVLVTYTGFYYERVRWPAQDQFWIGYWRQPFFNIRIPRCARREE